MYTSYAHQFFPLGLGETTFAKIHLLDTGLPQSIEFGKEAPNMSVANLMRLITIDFKSTRTW